MTREAGEGPVRGITTGDPGIKGLFSEEQHDEEPCSPLTQSSFTADNLWGLVAWATQLPRDVHCPRDKRPSCFKDGQYAAGWIAGIKIRDGNW